MEQLIRNDSFYISCVIAIDSNLLPDSASSSSASTGLVDFTVSLPLAGEAVFGSCTDADAFFLVFGSMRILNKDDFKYCFATPQKILQLTTYVSYYSGAYRR